MRSSIKVTVFPIAMLTVAIMAISVQVDSASSMFDDQQFQPQVELTPSSSFFRPERQPSVIMSIPQSFPTSRIWSSVGSAFTMPSSLPSSFASRGFHDFALPIANTFSDMYRLNRMTLPDPPRSSISFARPPEFRMNSVPSPDELAAYDQAWAQAYPSSGFTSTEDLAASFQRWPSEVMQVQVNTTGLAFLGMVGRPALVALDWVSKPFAGSIAHQIGKSAVGAAWEMGMSNLSSIDHTEELRAGLVSFNSNMGYLEEISDWSSFGANVAKAVGRSIETHPTWWFGNPPVFEAPKFEQYTWIHDTTNQSLNWGTLARGVGYEAFKKGFNMSVVGPSSYDTFREAFRVPTLSTPSLPSSGFQLPFTGMSPETSRYFNDLVARSLAGRNQFNSWVSQQNSLGTSTFNNWLNTQPTMPRFNYNDYSRFIMPRMPSYQNYTTFTMPKTYVPTSPSGSYSWDR